MFKKILNIFIVLLLFNCSSKEKSITDPSSNEPFWTRYGPDNTILPRGNVSDIIEDKNGNR